MKIDGMPRVGWFAALLLASGVCIAAERTENFDKDPGWEGHNNRSTREPRKIRQDFGYSMTAHAGGAAGELGGFITPSAEGAYYAKEIPEQTFNDSLSASGKLVSAGRQFHVLVGFFNAATAKEWRTANSIALRLQGRGEIFYVYVEYTTSKWRSGGDSPGGFSQIREAGSERFRLKGFPTGLAVHRWSLRYDPMGNGGTGSITVTMDDETAVCHLDAGHKADGASFNRFGLINVMKQADDGGEVWLDDVTVNGEMESFDRDPHWKEFQNRRTYITSDVRPRFDFGYSATHYAGGKAAGEMGGLVFRGDGRYTNLMAFYAARLEELTLERPLKASGKISLRRAVSDSDVLFGFFHAEHSLDSGGSDAKSIPPDLIGMAIGGPSREGFYVAPIYSLHRRESKAADRGPYLYPDGAPHDWTFLYEPGRKTEGAVLSAGVITVTLDDKRATLAVPGEHQAFGAHFNRFGIISTHTDGNVQHIYFDDLTYTWSQDTQ